MESKISSVNDIGGFEYISLDNTAFNEIEIQQLTAYKNTEQVYEYNLNNIDDKNDFIDKMNIFISAGYLEEHGAYASVQSSTITFGDGSSFDCMPNVSSDDVAHEFTHLVLGRIFNLSYDRNQATDRSELLGVALHEAISDIIAVLFTQNKYGVLDWSIFEEDCNKFVRFLNNPSLSDPPQKKLFGEELVPLGMAYDQYEWAGIISYWFYLLTDPMYKEENNVIIGEGIGIERTEQLMFRTLAHIKENITLEDFNVC